VDVEVIDDKDNVLLGRREVKVAIRFMGPTPDRKAVREALRAKLGVDPKLVVIGRIDQPFGSQRVEVEARIYKDEAGKSVEHEHTLKREEGKKEKKAEAKAPAPAKKEEKAAEKPPAKEKKAEKPAKPEAKKEEKGEKKPPAKEKKEKGK